MIMGDRKLDFEVGDIVILDKDTSCEQEVRVIDITPLELYATIESLEGGKCWNIMAYRLSPVTPSSVNERINDK